MATDFTIEPFAGTQKEDAARWFQRFEGYAQLKGLNASKKSAAFALLLRGTAADWFYSGHETTEFEQLKNEFLQRFQTSKPQWSKVAEIFKQNQRLNQGTLDYITQMQRLASEVSLPEEQLFQAIVRGLLPNIRQIVLQKDVKTLKELLEAAPSAERIASCSETDTLATDNATLLSALKELSTKVEALAISQVALTEKELGSQLNPELNFNSMARTDITQGYHPGFDVHSSTAHAQQQPLEYGVNHLQAPREFQPTQSYVQWQERHVSGIWRPHGTRT